MRTAITSAPVLVTGATGFIASTLVALLLDRGYRVRGTVRSLNKPDADVLRQLPGAPDRLELVEADLLHAGSFDAPAAGCEYVMHTASPYVLDVEDPANDLVAPALEGTRALLAACGRAGSVRRVVLTSSFAAITDEPRTDRALTEADWNTMSSLTRNPYYYSKTVAERAAWTFVDQEKPRFDLVVINPFTVIGPSLVPSLNTSNALFLALLNGTFPGILSMAWGFVDVRDVAEAHVRAMEYPGAHGRYICAGEVLTMRALVDLLSKNGYGAYRLPRMRLDFPFGTWLARLLSHTRPAGTGSYLRTHIGRVPRYDTTKIRTELGITFRPVAQTILETLQDLSRWKRLPPPP